MGRTIGRHIPGNKPPGDFVAVCDYCGVPWYASQLVRDGDGLLRCPDEGEGKSRGEQLEANREGSRGYLDRQRELAEHVYDARPFEFGDVEEQEPLPDPSSPPGAEDIFALEDIAVLLDSEDATSGASLADRTGNLTITAAGSAQPTRAASEMGGKSSLTFDGVNDTMSGTMIAPLLAGTRPFFWMLFSATATTPGADGHSYAWAYSAGQTTVAFNLWNDVSAATHWYRQNDINVLNHYQYVEGAAADLLPHYAFGSWSATLSEQYQLDGVSYTTSETGAPFTEPLGQDVGTVEIGAATYTGQGTFSFAPMEFAQLGILRRVPTASELVALQLALRHRAGLA